jgi:hypothetical protein
MSNITVPEHRCYFIEEYPLLIVKVKKEGKDCETTLAFNSVTDGDQLERQEVDLGSSQEYPHCLLMSSSMYYDNFTTLRNIIHSICYDTDPNDNYAFMTSEERSPIFTFSTEEWPSLINKLDCAFGKTPVMIIEAGEYNIHDLLREKLYGC